MIKKMIQAYEQDMSGGTTTDGDVTITNNVPNTSASAVISKVNGHLIFTLTGDAIPAASDARVDYVLTSGNTVVANGLIEDAGSATGDSTLAGKATFTIAQDVSGYKDLKLEINKPNGKKFLDEVAVEFTGLKVVAGADTSATLTTNSGSAADLKFKVDASELTTVNTAEVNFSATNINGTATGKTSGAITGGTMAASASVNASTYAVDDTKKVVVTLSLADVVNARKVSTTSSVSGYTVDSTSATKYISGACNIVLTGPKYVKDATVKYKTNKDLNTYSASSIDFSSGKGTIDVNTNLPATGDITVEIVAVVPAKYAAKVVVEEANGLTLDSTTTTDVAVTDGTTVTSTVLEGVIDTIFADTSTSTATAAKKVSLTVSGATFSNGQNTITTASALTTSNHATDAKSLLKTALNSMTLVNVTGEITFTVDANVD